VAYLLVEAGLLIQLVTGETRMVMTVRMPAVVVMVAGVAAVVQVVEILIHVVRL
jgi:hypothetical protein